MGYAVKKIFLFVFVLVAMMAVSCAKDTADTSDYGYVQFRLFKSGSYADNAETRAGTGQLGHLADAAKMRVTLRHLATDSEITQTLPVYAQSKELAEYGLQSDPLMLLAGDYELVDYRMFNKLDVVISGYRGEPDEKTIINIARGGLVLQDIVVAAANRGGIKLRLVKDNIADITPTTRAGETMLEDAFRTIVAFDVTLDPNSLLGTDITLEKLPVHHEYFRSEDNPNYYTSEAVCDSVIMDLIGGSWSVKSIRVYFDDKNYIQYEDMPVVAANSFYVADNNITEVRVPITMDENAADIQDALALKAIWDALDGPNWRVKWDFERDIDLWTAQPGISTLSNGRVAVLDLSNVGGAKGAMPAAIADLTELRQIYLGSHSWYTSAGAMDPNLAAAARRKPTIYNPATDRWDVGADFYRTFIDNSTPYHKFSPELQDGFRYEGVEIKKVPALRELPLAYKGGVSAGGTRAGSARATRADNPLNYSNRVTSLPDEINTLSKLEALYIGHSAMTTLPADMSGMTNLADVEIFACHDMTEFPDGLTTLPKLTTLIVSSNPKLTEQEMYDGLTTLNASATAGKSIQVLQLSGQPMTKIPSLQGLTNMGQLDIQNCGVDELEDDFVGQFIGIINASYNKLTALPRGADGRSFMDLDGEVETFNFSNNEFTEFPDIFDATNMWKMSNVDFSNNKITAFENGNSDDPTASTYHGLNVKFLVLAYNDFTIFPKELFHKGSYVEYLQIQGNKISFREDPDGPDSNGRYETPDDDAFDPQKAKNISFLTTLDMSYNQLERLPRTFNGTSLPFMTGLDLSYNRFTAIPMSNVFNIARLGIIIFRGQRDASGNRCMTTWPAGAYAHQGLRAMYLGGNDLGYVGAGEFDLQHGWNALEIADNPNISIDVSGLCYLISIGMMFAYDPWQDINGCPILRLDE